MLLIAQPKSASTSLTYSISKMARLNYKLGVPRTDIDIDCDGFFEIQKYHNNMVERNFLFLKQVMTGQKTLFKEHLLPTERHFRIIEKIRAPIVILIRDFDDSLDSYKRLGVKNCDFKQLQIDLYEFHNRWMLWKSNKPYAILIEYRDLVLNFHHEMRRIFKHFKLTLPKNFNKYKLERKKFTGIGLKRIKNDIV